MKRPKTLNARFVETVNRPGRYGDGHGGLGLTLLVKHMVNGRLSKTWSQRIRVNEKVTNVGLGAYPAITLAKARERALENARLIADGKDPRPGGGVPTFRGALEKVLDIQRPNWRNPKSEKQWRASLDTYAQRLMRKPVSEIHSGDVMAVLSPIWNKRRETAQRVRQRIGAVMKWSVAQGLRPDNPAGEQVLQALPKNGVRQKHQRALPHAEVGAAIRKLRGTDAWAATKLALEFLTLTATRSGEVRLAKWSEIDLNARTWTIPGTRMKAGRAHRVPLSDRAVAILREAFELSGGVEWVFPSPTGRPLSDNTLSKLFRDNAIGCVPHGMRSSFRDWGGDTGQPREVLEQALAHVIKGKSEAAYARSDLFDRRRELMEAWARYLDDDSAKVVAICA